MYCYKCGNKIPDGAKFCNICGSEVKRKKEFDGENLTEEYNNLTEQINVNNEEMRENNEPKDKNKVIIGTIIVLALVVSAVVGYNYLHKNSNNLSQNKKGNVVFKKDDSSETKEKKESNDLPSATMSEKELNDESTKSSSDYLFPDSASRKLEDSELQGQSVENLALGRNEIFARHGYVFKEEPYKSYFANKTWYVQNSSFVANEENLNEYENYNVQMFLKYEKREF